MTPGQMAALRADYDECRYRDPEDLPTLQQAENALRYVAHHPVALIPPAAAEMLLCGLSRLHQVERSARTLLDTPSVRAMADAGEPVHATGPDRAARNMRDALRANLGNGRSLNDEAGR